MTDDFPSAPWHAEPPSEDDYAHVWASDGDLVCTVCESLPHGETHMDRAELIEAATELLAAARKAEQVLSWVEDKPPTAQREEVEALEELRDAIDKAT